MSFRQYIKIKDKETGKTVEEFQYLGNNCLTKVGSQLFDKDFNKKKVRDELQKLSPNIKFKIRDVWDEKLSVDDELKGDMHENYYVKPIWYPTLQEFFDDVNEWYKEDIEFLKDTPNYDYSTMKKTGETMFEYSQRTFTDFNLDRFCGYYYDEALRIEMMTLLGAKISKYTKCYFEEDENEERGYKRINVWRENYSVEITAG